MLNQTPQAYYLIIHNGSMIIGFYEQPYLSQELHQEENLMIQNKQDLMFGKPKTPVWTLFYHSIPVIIEIHHRNKIQNCIQEKFLKESWVQIRVLRKIIIDEQSQNQLQESVRLQESSQSLNNENIPNNQLKWNIERDIKLYCKGVKQDMGFYKKFYADQTYKNTASLIASQLEYLFAERYLQNEQELTHPKKKFFYKEVTSIADQELAFESSIPNRNLNQRLSIYRIPNLSQQNFESPLEFQHIKLFVAHEVVNLNIFSRENLLFTASIKSVKILGFGGFDSHQYS
ncbi:hypothetical protein pb186bvf_019094 [Paramecium bursaria]